jgi:hypothetical protein
MIACRKRESASLNMHASRWWRIAHSVLAVWSHGSPSHYTVTFLLGCARAMREDNFELRWSFELTMLASLSADVLVLARCAVGGGCGATGWRRQLRAEGQHGSEGAVGATAYTGCVLAAVDRGPRGSREQRGACSSS